MATNGDLILISNGVDKFAKLKNSNNYELNDKIVNNALLDKIRKRSKQTNKTWNDLAKLSRTFLNEKRSFLNDQHDKTKLQHCLDTIQKSIKITSLQSMIERLETITRQLGLKLMTIDKVSNQNVFISSEMFYVEVILDSNSGYVNDVKIAHSQSEPLSCAELTKVLRDADFVEFNKHLNGLIAIYKLNADKYVLLLLNEIDFLNFTI